MTALCARAAGLAWLAALPLLTGCLIDDPPPYRAPPRTAPRINGLRVQPPVDLIITYPPGSTEGISFRIPITSEDAGDPVQARLFVNYANIASSTQPFERLPASTLDEGERTASFTWFPDFSSPPGCYRLIVRVSHESNWRGAAELYDPSDVDEVSWFAKIFVEAPASSTLVDCPFPSSNPQ
jgi:hypothetical protein